MSIYLWPKPELGLHAAPFVINISPYQTHCPVHCISNPLRKKGKKQIKNETRIDANHRSHLQVHIETYALSPCLALKKNQYYPILSLIVPL